LEELEIRGRGVMGRAYATRAHYMMDHIRHIIHAIVPNYADTTTLQERTTATSQLRAAYLDALRVQMEMNHGNSIAFPTMGVNNEFPPALGAQIALEAIRDFIHEHGGRRNFDYITIIVPPKSASERAYRVYM
jgi:O-acetyl-ADP-ribose deacetylase (regulator of RNase III)